MRIRDTCSEGILQRIQRSPSNDDLFFPLGSLFALGSATHLHMIGSHDLLVGDDDAAVADAAAIGC